MSTSERVIFIHDTHVMCYLAYVRKLETPKYLYYTSTWAKISHVGSSRITSMCLPDISIETYAYTCLLLVLPKQNITNYARKSTS